MAKPKDVKLFISLFPPSPVKHGRMRKYDPDTGKKSTVTVNEKVTLDMVKEHLAHEGQEGRLGYMPGTETGTKVGVVDIDLHIFKDGFDNMVQQLSISLNSAGVTWYKEISTNGGVHAWVFCEEEVPYETMHYFLKSIVLSTNQPNLEVFPSSAKGGTKGRWIYVPYSGSFNDPDGLGTTYLQTPGGETIPVQLLNNVVHNPAALIRQGADDYLKMLPELKEQAEADAAPLKDFAPEEAWAELSRAVLNPPERKPGPEGWPRHDTVISFLNLADRADHYVQMRDLLKTQEVFDAWVDDDSRDYGGWVEEVDRWDKRWQQDARDTSAGGRYGLKFLNGWKWNLGSIKRRPHALLFESPELNKVPEQELAEAVDGYMRHLGEHWYYDPDVVMGYHFNGYTYVAEQGWEEKIKQWVETKLLESRKGLRESKLTNMYKKLERLFLSRPLNAQVSDDFIATENGVLEWKTGQLHEHDPNMLTIGMVHANYDPEIDWRQGAWQDFLDRAFAGQPPQQIQAFKDALAEFAGYSLLRHGRMRKMLNLHGPSSTGKTTAWRIMLGVLGDASMGVEGALGMSTDQDLFEAQDWATQLVGPSLVVFDEMNTGDPRTGRKVVNTLKILAGNGAVTINPKGKQSVSTRLGCKVMFCTNYDLRVFEDSSNDALFRRIVRIPFQNVIDIGDETPMYEEEVLEDPLERTRVFMWMLDGLKRLANSGWRMTNETFLSQQLDEARESANPVIQYLKECCVVGADYETPARDLHQDFQTWAGLNSMRGYYDISAQSFGRRMTDALLKLGWNREVTKTKKDVVVWEHLGIQNWEL